MNTLRALDARLGRSKWRKTSPAKRPLSRDELICRLAVAKSKAGRAWNLIHITLPKEGEPVTPATFTWNLDWPHIREARAKTRPSCSPNST